MEENQEKIKKTQSQKKHKKIKKFLPIGTVVLIKDAKKRVMITGFCAEAQNDNSKKMYDYCGVVYPEGVISMDQLCLFNHNQIAKIYHLGLYKDYEQREFNKKLHQLVNNSK